MARHAAPSRQNNARPADPRGATGGPGVAGRAAAEVAGGGHLRVAVRLWRAARRAALSAAAAFAGAEPDLLVGPPLGRFQVDVVMASLTCASDRPG